MKRDRSEIGFHIALFVVALYAWGQIESCRLSEYMREHHRCEAK